jgi:diadenosine tetraphosphatase ApaH/serine/threonine PP2A family protein phosphatase
MEGFSARGKAEIVTAWRIQRETLRNSGGNAGKRGHFPGRVAAAWPDGGFLRGNPWTPESIGGGLDGWRIVAFPMPRIAILSDVHANAPALDAVLREVAKAKVGRIVWGGDVVGYGASSNACVSRVRELGGECVMGNHDYYTNQIRRDRGILPANRDWRKNPVWAGVEEAARTLTEDNAAWLRTLPRRLEIPGGVVAHSALHHPDEWPYLRSFMDALPTLDMLRESATGIGFFGHTHRQEIFFDPTELVTPERINRTRTHLPEGVVCAVLVGSVGQPRDGDLRAGWTLWDSDTRVVEFRRTAYSALEAAHDIIAADLPVESALRLLDDETAREFRRMLGL